MDGFWLVAIVIWAACGFVCYGLAKEKGAAEPAGWFVGGLVFGPVAVVVAYLTKPH